MTGQPSDYELHYQLEFGEYAQVHESHDSSMITQTTGTIALCPTGNSQGGYYFMSLMTGNRLNRYAWTPLPMPREVIERVHALTRRNPAGGAMVFGCRNGTPLPDEQDDDDDDANDEDYLPSDVESDSNDDGSYAAEPPHPVAGVGNYYHDGQQLQQPFHKSADNSDGNNDENAFSGDDDDDDAGEVDDEDQAGDAADKVDDENQDDNTANEGHTVEVPDELDNVDDMMSEDDAAGAGVPSTGVPSTGVPSTGVPVANKMDGRYGRRQRSGLRSRKAPRSAATIKEPQSSAHHALNATLGRELSGLEGFSDFEHMALTQYNLKQDLEIYGKAAANAVVNEMK
jgi:hypothetical protein